MRRGTATSRMGNTARMIFAFLSRLRPAQITTSYRYLKDQAKDRGRAWFAQHPPHIFTLGLAAQGQPSRIWASRALTSASGRWLFAASLLTILSIALMGIAMASLIGPYAAIEPAARFTGATFQIMAQQNPSEDGVLQSAALRLQQTTPAEPRTIRTTVSLDRGDTLMEALTDAGAERADAYHAITALRPIYDPRKLKAGQEIALTFEQSAEHQEAERNALSTEENNTSLRLTALSLQPEIEREVAIRLTETGNYAGEEIIKDLHEAPVRTKGTINSSLFLAADEAGVPPAVTIEMIRMYSYSIDFQRDIQPGDSFEVFFTRKYDEHGTPVKEGDVLYANLTIGGKSQRLWRYAPNDGPWDYFDESGQSAKKFLMKTPIDGARLSSGFGKRTHPILGYTKMHTGTDFAAPRGTPIYAAGDGTIIMAQRYGGYGNYVAIRHANGYETAYAHMNGYARGIKKGARIRQGQTIGYVGSTGRSTGPHLHYEVHVNGTKVNPQRIKVPTGRKLAGAELAAFKSARTQINTMMAATPALTRLAEARIGNSN